ncbi:tripartite tricarboxylate transporter TctB family protein [Rhodobacteraceae bacterium NNCM2]|nr:tripartite tricarboxylate transporter TctB family protein [Coraliihabitans acroporae]
MTDHAQSPGPAPTGQTSRLADRVVALVIVTLTGLFLYLTFGEVSAFAQASAGRGPFFFPRIVLIAMLIAEVFLLRNVFSDAGGGSLREPTLKLLGLVVATGAYCALIPELGFLLSSIAFGFTVPVMLGRRDYLLIGAIAVVYSVAVWALFERVFLIILPLSPFDIGF